MFHAACVQYDSGGDGKACLAEEIRDSETIGVPGSRTFSVEFVNPEP